MSVSIRVSAHLKPGSSDVKFESKTGENREEEGSAGKVGGGGGGGLDVWTELPSISKGAKALEMSLSCRESKAGQREEHAAQKNRPGQETVRDPLDKQIGLQAKRIKRLSWAKKTKQG